MKKPVSELKLGDKVRTFDASYNTSTVIKIKDGVIDLYRPYVHFDPTVGIAYIGTETFQLLVTDSRPIEVLSD